MAERPRVAIHVCNHCSAMWEGPNPPPQCPQCGASTGWRSGEIGDQPGAIGGRIFVPGSDRPMTAVYICTACTKTIVVRNGGEPPEECPFCKAGAEHITEAMVVKKKPPVAPSARAAAEVAVDRNSPRKAAEPMSRLPQVHVPEKYEGETAPILTAEQYRAEWIAERVVAWLDSGATWQEPEHPWAAAELLYDEGKRRGHLP